MNTAYPVRPKVAAWVRYPSMVLGVACIIGAIDSVRSSPLDLSPLLGGLLVGGAGFAFGFYGGLPLVNTVGEWHPAVTLDQVNAMHRSGLLVMRRRRWMMWISGLAAVFVAVLFLIPILILAGQPGLIVLVLGAPLAIINCRYLLSRCPRCGYGFFTRSTSRAATLSLRKTCGHCGLSLYAYKDQKS